MGFIVEDGTGLENALSLVSVEFADNYFTQRGNQTWLALNLEQKQVNLVKATDYINIRFNYKNEVVNKDQSLSFPRKEIGLPVDVLKACCEYAIRANSGELTPDIEQDASGLLVTAKTEKIGPIEESYTFAGATASDVRSFKRYPAADNLLRKYIKTVGRGTYR